MLSAGRSGTITRGMPSISSARLWLIHFRPKVSAIASRLTGIPVIGVLGLIVQDWLPLIDEYYYCKHPPSAAGCRRLTSRNRYRSLIRALSLQFRDRLPGSDMVNCEAHVKLYTFGILYLPTRFFWSSLLLLGKPLPTTARMPRIAPWLRQSPYLYLSTCTTILDPTPTLSLCMEMPDSFPPHLPAARRIVTGHDEAGRAAFLHDDAQPLTESAFGPHLLSGPFWMTRETPSRDNTSKWVTIG